LAPSIDHDVKDHNSSKKSLKYEEGGNGRGEETVERGASDKGRSSSEELESPSFQTLSRSA